MSESNGNGVHLGPSRLERVVEDMIYNEFTLRREAYTRLMDPNRDYDRACGLPGKGVLDPQWYQDIYDFDAIGNRAIEVYPKECLQVTPWVYEKEKSETATEFEEAWDEFGRSLLGEPNYYQEEKCSPVWDTVLQADINCGICQFGIVLLGYDDDRPYSQPVKGLKVADQGGAYLPPTGPPAPIPAGSSVPPPGVPLTGPGSYFPYLPAGRVSVRPPTPEQMSKGAPAGSNKVLFLRVFPQSQVEIAEYETNRNSPRYGQPVMYKVTMAAPNTTSQVGSNAIVGATEDVHWTRVIHIPSDGAISPVAGPPRVQAVRRNLIGLVKLYCASPEMFWRAGMPILNMRTDTSLGPNVKVNWEGVKDEYEKLMADLQRIWGTKNLIPEMLAPSVSDPSPFIERQIEAICVKLGIPVRVFKGSERGELASSQDDAAWNDRLRARQKNFITPRIIIPLVNRLIWTGVLPPPKTTGKDGGFKVEWPDLTSQTAQEKAIVAKTMVETLAAYTGPGNAHTVLSPMDLWVRVLGKEEEEADAILAGAEAATEEIEQADMELQQEKIDKGLAPDPAAPPGPGKPPGGPPGAGGGANPAKPKPPTPPTANQKDRTEKARRLRKAYKKVKAERDKILKEREREREAAALEREERERERQAFLLEQQKAAATASTGARVQAGSGLSYFSDRTENVFCPTGKGGGIDPTCSKGGGSSGTSSSSSAASGSSPSGTGKGAGSGEFTPPDKALLERANVKKTLHAGVNLVETPGGTQVVVKGRVNRRDSVQNEILANSLAKTAGVEVVPVAHVKLHGQDHAVSPFAEGTPLGKMTPTERKAAVAKVPRDQLDNNALFDYAIGNKDPNTGNFMIKPDGGMLALDKEQTLGKGMGKRVMFRAPEHLDPTHELDRGRIKEMSGKARKMADDLERQGKSAEAKGVRNRADVLAKFADSGGPTTVADLVKFAENADKQARASRGFLTRAKEAMFGE